MIVQLSCGLQCLGNKPADVIRPEMDKGIYLVAAVKTLN